MSATAQSGLQPTHATEIGISTTGVPETLANGTYSTILDLEGCNVSVDGTLQEWSAMSDKGWGSAMMTGKKLTLSCTVKRRYGDTVHDYIAQKSMQTGTSCNTAYKITFPNLDTLIVPCVINFKSFGGESTDVDAMSFDLVSTGMPTYTAYTS